MFWLCRMTIILLATMCLQPALARIIYQKGDQTQEAELIKTLAAGLDNVGVDAVLGPGGLPPPPTRPRVAALAGFKPGKSSWGDIADFSWSTAFKKGVAGVVIAYKADEQAGSLVDIKAKCEGELQSVEKTIRIDGCNFVARWLAARKEQRIFISFTSADLAYAVRVRQRLEALGYTAFLFQTEKFGSPWFDPSITGEVFAQAGHKLVIDTINARGAPGVALEATCEDLLTPVKKSNLAKFLASYGT